ncbi:UNKNOWN [Stylonychia lemnae]|uniref:Calmodulin-lysine N-methyltransferase n=1 Tax=Stylonychia lemnae TaxID=5949 RepID=A0A078B9W9_STYLE|nr:UNKNOWN [Stylonychia lemnae]|eukprot:CDW91006.1 UNKNOWN [Stylonychia lemnae]
MITDRDSITLKEQVIFQGGQEGKRVWEAGIAISRYIISNKGLFQGKAILDLGSGTGIGALTLMKFTEAQKVILSDYTEEILELLTQNRALQPRSQVAVDTKLVDWTIQETYEQLYEVKIDFVIATDVIYKGSPYDHLATLLYILAEKQNPRILIIIPRQRDCCQDFLRIMKEKGFNWTETELNDNLYSQKALENQKDSDKFYPGLKSLNFVLYTFNL